MSIIPIAGSVIANMSPDERAQLINAAGMFMSSAVAAIPISALTIAVTWMAEHVGVKQYPNGQIRPTLIPNNDEDYMKSNGIISLAPPMLSGVVRITDVALDNIDAASNVLGSILQFFGVKTQTQV